MKFNNFVLYGCVVFSLAGCQFFGQQEISPLKRLQAGKNVKPSDVIEFQNKMNLDLNNAQDLIELKKYEEAEQKIHTILSNDNNNKQALFLSKKIQQQRIVDDLIKQADLFFTNKKYTDAKILVSKVLGLDPNNIEAIKLRDKIHYLEINENNSKESSNLDKMLSLEFKKAPLIAVLDLISQYSGINFVIDKDTDISNVSTTIFAKNTTVSEVLNLIIKTNNLKYTKLNNQTFLIYANNEIKNNTYDEFYTQTFYLNAIPVDKAKEMIEKLYSPKSVFADNKLNFLVVRDKKGVVESIEKLLATVDVDTPEVLLNIEILEVAKDSLLGLGVKIPDKIDMRVLNSLGNASNFTINDIKNFTSDSLRLLTTDPIASLNLKQTSSKSNLLANPRIRVKSKELASFLIGDKVPVITTTTGESTNFLSESVNYLDVGLKLEILPIVNKNNQIDVDIKLEVSNIVKEINSKNGLLAYQIGTRNTSTKLQLSNGETQMLAGLIKDDTKTSASHIPGIGRFPILGRLFSNTSDNSTKNEIVLLITPYVVKPFNAPEADSLSFYSGTYSDISTMPLRVSEQTSLPNKSLQLGKSSTTNGQENFEPKEEMPFKLFLQGASTAINNNGEAILTLQHTPSSYEKISIITSLSDNLKIADIKNMADTKFIGEEKIQAKRVLHFSSNGRSHANVAIFHLSRIDPKVNHKEKILIEKILIDGKELNVSVDKDLSFD